MTLCLAAKQYHYVRSTEYGGAIAGLSVMMVTYVVDSRNSCLKFTKLSATAITAPAMVSIPSYNYQNDS